MKIPTIWATGVICLVLGVAIGILAAMYLGIGGYNQTVLAPSPAAGGAGGAPAGAAKGAPGGPAGKMGGPSGPSAASQLVTLVTKLDVLTNAPLSVTLVDDQKAAVAEQLTGLDELDYLPEADAQKRLDALFEILAEHKDALTAVGVRWPGAGGGGFRAPYPNPFQATANAQALSSLQERVKAAPTE